MEKNILDLKLSKLSKLEKKSILGGKDSTVGRDSYSKDSTVGRDSYSKDSTVGRDSYSKDSTVGRDS
jgi:hypothetical protein